MWESLIIYEKLFAEVVGMVCVYVYNFTFNQNQV